MSINNNTLNNNENHKTINTTSAILPSPVYTHPYHHSYSSLYQQHISATSSLLSISNITTTAAENHTSDKQPETAASKSTTGGTSTTSDTTSDIATATNNDTDAKSDVNYTFVKREVTPVGVSCSNAAID